MKSDLRLFGIRGFLLAGLPACFASKLLKWWRRWGKGYYIKERLAHLHLRAVLYVSGPPMVVLIKLN